jgi:hypothetical protein
VLLTDCIDVIHLPEEEQAIRRGVKNGNKNFQKKNQMC